MFCQEMLKQVQHDEAQQEMIWGLQMRCNKFCIVEVFFVTDLVNDAQLNYHDNFFAIMNLATYRKNAFKK
jgi:hypothetical protein